MKKKQANERNQTHKQNSVTAQGCISLMVGLRVTAMLFPDIPLLFAQLAFSSRVSSNQKSHIKMLPRGGFFL